MIFFLLFQNHFRIIDGKNIQKNFEAFILIKILQYKKNIKKWQYKKNACVRGEESFVLMSTFPSYEVE